MAAIGLRFKASVAALAFFAAAGGRADAAAPAWLDAIAPRLDAEIRRHMTERHIPGLAVAIVAEGRLAWSHDYGVADLASGRAVGPDTRFGIGSITKLFTALAVLRLRDQGRLGLDDRVASRLAWFRLADDPAPAITIRELLLQLGGLPREAPGVSWSAHTIPDAETLAAGLGTMPAALPREAMWKYSNLGYALLGFVVEAAAGRPYAAYLASDVLAPLGMTETGFDQAGARAIGYEPAPNGEPAARAPLDQRAVAAAGGLYATARDLARLLIWMTSDGEAGPVGAATRREMLRVQAVFPDWSGGQGLGFETRKPAGAKPHIGHAGSAGGFTARLEIDPATKSGLVVLTNDDNGEPTRLVDALEAILESSVPPQPEPVADPAWNQYCGRYRSSRGESGIEIVDGRLTWYDPAAPHPAATRIAFDPAGLDRFRFRSGALIGEILTFDRDAGGHVVAMHAAGATDRRE